ncbi:TIGR00730 family Rossman fold protein [Uliginosibacterium sp. H1]|uniref:LOG family protein n=1 Tax=Uliginosibacterium sp. H1 TaxID=3114757 RepID=UPI002E199EE5|nr:TIGR00730 family Rossman fold protein [Uliginosibacterium sp. H1]
MKSVCVFCGASAGDHPIYTEAAQALGRAIAQSGRRLVYGGGHVGLMGVVADAALAAGGEVIGVIPDALVARELAHPALTELHVVPSMHARKALMADLSEGFLAMPGGIGTLEELFEVWTWGQLGLHAKPYGIFNVAGYYDGLLGFLDHVHGEGFLRAEHRRMLLVGSEPAGLLESMESQPRQANTRWIDSGNT